MWGFTALCLSVYVVWEGQLCSAGVRVRVRVTEPHDAGLHEDSFKTELARIPHADTHPSALMKLEGGCDPAAPVQTRRSAHLQVLVISCLDYQARPLQPDSHPGRESGGAPPLWTPRCPILVWFQTRLHVTIMSTRLFHIISISVHSQSPETDASLMILRPKMDEIPL